MDPTSVLSSVLDTNTCESIKHNPAQPLLTCLNVNLAQMEDDTDAVANLGSRSEDTDTVTFKIEKTEPEKPTSKKPKPRSLPPPGEAFQPPDPKKKSTAKKSTAETKAPARSAVVAKKTKDSFQKRGAKAAATKRGKHSKIKHEGMMSVLNSHSATKNIYTRSAKAKAARPSVLIRPTEKTKRIKERLAAMKPKNQSVQQYENIEDVDFKGRSFLQELPKEIRAMIWRYAVVEPSFFIWPEQPTGKEQPDLAMTCRGFREEVLPIFYAENIFAVNVSPNSSMFPRQRIGRAKLFGGRSSGTANGGNESGIQIPVIKKWAAALEEGGCFGMIRRWAFSYTDPMAILIASRAFEQDDFDGPEKSLVVAVTVAKRQDGGWFLPEGVQIHREAVCILTGHEDFGRCIVKEPPKWLNSTVCSVLDAAKGGYFTGEMVADLAKSIHEDAMELAGYRCEEAVSSIEAIFGGEIL